MNDESNVRKLTNMGRRRMLSALSSLGVSAATLNVLTKEALAEETQDIKDEIPYVSRFRHTNHEDVVKNGAVPQREPIFETWKYDSWLKAKAAADAQRKIQSKISKIAKTDLIYSTVTKRVRNKSERNVVLVKYVSERREDGKVHSPKVDLSKISDNLPGTVDGIAPDGEVIEEIPIITERVDTEVQAYYDHNYDPVPGGCQMETNSDLGTMTTSAYSNRLNKFVLATAGHLGSSGEYVYQPSYAEYIGDCTSNWQSGTSFDAGIIEPAGTTNVKYDIAADQANTYRGWTIHGKVTWEDIQNDYQNSNKVYEFQGRSTGLHKNFEITDFVTPYNCSSTFGVPISTSCGDSGGPYFKEFDDESFIAGIHRNTEHSTVWDMVECRWNVYI